MGAVRYRVIAGMRRRPAALIVPVLLVGIVFATVLSLAGGARRTSTAPTRFGRAVGGAADGLLYQYSGRPRTSEIRGLAGVREVQSFTYVYVNLAAFSVDKASIDTFAGATPLPDRLVAGRLLDTANPGEVMVNEKLVRSLGAKLGDRFPVTSFSREQVEAGGFAAPPEGPTFEVELVGVTSGPGSLDDESFTVMFSPAILDKDMALEDHSAEIRR